MCSFLFRRSWRRSFLGAASIAQFQAGPSGGQKSSRTTRDPLRVNAALSLTPRRLLRWTTNRSAIRPDPLHPVHRHDVGRVRPGLEHQRYRNEAEAAAPAGSGRRSDVPEKDPLTAPAQAPCAEAASRPRGNRARNHQSGLAHRHRHTSTRAGPARWSLVQFALCRSASRASASSVITFAAIKSRGA